MATPTLDVSLLNYFSPLLVFLFLWALFFALFRWKNFFGDVPSIHAIMALVIAFFGGVFSESVRELIQFLIPWFVVIMVIVVLVLMLVKMLGVDDDTITTVAKSPGVYWTIIIVALVVVLGGLAEVFGEQTLRFTQGGNTTQVSEGENMTTSTGDVETNIGKTFYHPKVLGFILIIVLMSIGVKMLSGPSK
ncbi:MAG: hypothetical protein ACOCQX_03110 [Candidatus Nanoarchaeia archaeon]